ncbi:MAG: hypothetical protein JKY48_18785 [Flavobacteriales bacterium]|nr:hypothetical protein [Flavobacteriales bacterium]
MKKIEAEYPKIAIEVIENKDSAQESIKKAKKVVEEIGKISVSEASTKEVREKLAGAEKKLENSANVISIEEEVKEIAEGVLEEVITVIEKIENEICIKEANKKIGEAQIILKNTKDRISTKDAKAAIKKVNDIIAEIKREISSEKRIKILKRRKVKLEDIKNGFTASSNEIAVKSSVLTVSTTHRDELLTLVKNPTSTDGALVFLAGKMEIGTALKMESVLGLAVTNNGFATYFQFKGTVAKIITLKLGGDISYIKTESGDTEFKLNGHSELSLVGQEKPIMAGTLSVTNNELNADGEINISLAEVISFTSIVNAKISNKSNINFYGKSELKLSGKSIMKGELSITNDEFHASGKIDISLGEVASFTSSVDGRISSGGDFEFKGAANLMLLGQNVMTGALSITNDKFTAAGKLGFSLANDLISFTSAVKATVSKEKGLEFKGAAKLMFLGQNVMTGALSITNDEFIATGKLGFSLANDLISFTSAVKTAVSKEKGLEFKGAAKLMLLGQNVMTGALSITNDEFKIYGDINLFPEGSPISLTAHIDGEISKSKIHFEGHGKLIYKQTTIVAGSLTINEKELKMHGKFLGSTVDFSLDEDGSMSGATHFDYAISIGLSGLLSVDVFVKLNTSITIEQGTCSIALSAACSANGEGFNVTTSIDNIPTSLSKLKDAIYNEIESKVTGAASSFKEELDKEVKIIEETFSNATKSVTDEAEKAVDTATEEAEKAIDLASSASSTAIRGFNSVIGACDKTISGCISGLSDLVSKIGRWVYETDYQKSERKSEEKRLEELKSDKEDKKYLYEQKINDRKKQARIDKANAIKLKEANIKIANKKLTEEKIKIKKYKQQQLNLLESGMRNKYLISKITTSGKLSKDTPFIKPTIEQRAKAKTLNKYYTKLISFSKDNKTYIAGQSLDGQTFLIQKIRADGELDAITYIDNKWSNKSDTLTVLTVNEKVYLFGQSKKNDKGFIKEVLSDGKLSKENSCLHVSPLNYQSQLVSYTVDNKTFILGKYGTGDNTNFSIWQVVKKSNKLQFNQIYQCQSYIFDSNVGEKINIDFIPKWITKYESSMSIIIVKSEPYLLYIYKHTNRTRTGAIIYKVLDTGLIADKSVYSSKNWSDYFPNLFSFNKDRKTYVGGQSEDLKTVFLQKVYFNEDRKLHFSSDIEYKNWSYGVGNLLPVKIGDNVLLCGQVNAISDTEIVRIKAERKRLAKERKKREVVEKRENSKRLEDALILRDMGNKFLTTKLNPSAKLPKESSFRNLTLEQRKAEGAWYNYYPSLVTFSKADKTYFAGQSLNGKHFFITEIKSDGKLGTSPCMKNDWNNNADTLTVLNVNDKLYLLGQSKINEEVFIKEVFSNGKLSEENSYLDGLSTYQSQLISYTVGHNTFILGKRGTSKNTAFSIWKLVKKSDKFQLENIYECSSLEKASDGTLRQNSDFLRKWKSIEESATTIIYVKGEPYLLYIYKYKNGTKTGAVIYKVLENGKLAGGSVYSHSSWDNYYPNLFSFNKGKKTYIGGQSEDLKTVFIMSAKSDGTLDPYSFTEQEGWKFGIANLFPVKIGDDILFCGQVNAVV